MRSRATLLTFIVLCAFVWVITLDNPLAFGICVVIGGLFGLGGLILCPQRVDKLIAAAWVAVAGVILFWR